MSSASRSRKDKEIIAEYESQVKEIRAQLVEQQKCLEQQTEMRVQLLQDLQDFFRKKAEIEVEYSRNLEKLAERFMAKTRSTKDHQQYKEAFASRDVSDKGHLDFTQNARPLRPNRDTLGRTATEGTEPLVSEQPFTLV
ncbi:SLIT-ROBO Rho GTPase-activating protein 1-like [Arapaima gigas]